MEGGKLEDIRERRSKRENKRKSDGNSFVLFCFLVWLVPLIFFLYTSSWSGSNCVRVVRHTMGGSGRYAWRRGNVVSKLTRQ